MKKINNLSSLVFRSKPIGIFFISLLFLFPANSFSTNYYGVNGTTNVATATLTCWGTNTDGTGTNPTTFNNAADKFIIPVGCTMTLSAIFTLNGATLDVFGTLIGGTSPIKGTGEFILEAGGTLKTSNTNGINPGGASGAIQTTGKTFNATANYELNGIAAQAANNPTSANNIVISNTGGIVTLTNTVTTLTGTFTVNPNATLNIGVKTIRGTGSFSLGAGATLKTTTTTSTPLTDAFVFLTGTKTFDPAANYIFSIVQTVDQGITEITTANNIEINVTGTPANLTLNTPLTVNGVLTLTAGTLSLGTSNLTIKGTTSGAGSINNSSTGLLIYNGSSAQTISNLTSNTVNNLTINNSAGVTLGGTTTVNGTLSLTAGTLTNGTNLTLGNSASIVRTAGSLSAIPTFGTAVNLSYNNTASQTTSYELPTSSSVLNNLTINNAAGLTLNAATTVNGTLTLTAGTLTNGTNLTLGNSASIVRTAGSLSAIPTFGTAVNLSYNGTSTKGNEFPSGDIINTLTANNTAGITLGDNRTIPNLTIGSGSSLTLNAGKQLTVSTTMSNSGTLNLLSDESSSTATILTPTTISGVGGTCNVNQYLTSLRNWYISSPVTGATTASGYVVYQYREPGDNTNYTNPATAYWESITQGATFENGRGYIALPASGPVTLTFTGALNSGSITTGSLTRTTNASKLGFNLVGNPYPAYLNLATMDSTKVIGSFWLRSRNSGDTAYDFDTYNLTSGLGISKSSKSITSYIPPMQAFWIRVKQGQSPANLSFSNTMCGHKNTSNNIFRAPSKSNQTQQVLYLQVSNGVNMDETILAFNSNASNGYDAYDSPKMAINSPSIPELFTMVDSEQLAINGMNSIPYDAEINLGFTTGTAGTFSIKASQLVNFDPTVSIYLKDYNNLANTPVQLTADAVYTFSSTITSNNNSRFALVFRAPSIATGINPDCNTNEWISIRNGQLLINGAELNGAMLEVFNAVGQKLISKNLTAKNVQLNSSLNAGVYFVKVTNEGKSITRKIIIN